MSFLLHKNPILYLFWQKNCTFVGTVVLEDSNISFVGQKQTYFYMIWAVNNKLMIRHWILCFLIVCLSLTGLFAQNKNSKIDSLENILQTAAQDTNRVKTLNSLVWQYRSSNLEKGIEYALQAQNLAEKLQYPYGLSESYSMGGIVYRNKGDYAHAMEMFFKALHIAEKHGFRKQIAYSNNNIGDVFKSQGDTQKAAEYTQKAIVLFKEIKDLRGLAYGYIRMGEIAESSKEFEKALSYYTQCFDIRQKLKDKDGLESILNRIGRTYEKLDKFEKALENLQLSLQYGQEINDLKGIAGNSADIGRVYHSLNENEKAIEWAEKGLKVAKEVGYKEPIRNAAQVLSEIYSSQKQFDKAFEYQKIYVETRESLISDEISKAVSEMALSYQIDKQKAELEIFEKERENQNLVRYSLIIGLTMAVGLLFVLYINNQNKRKANYLLQSQKAEIEAVNETLNWQKAEIEKKNEDVRASIAYAKRIQDAMLPRSEDISKAFPEHFIFYRPRDIVSGDFYWFLHKNSKSFMGAVDCTGHGVPGAFMSMIGNDLLNNIVNISRVFEPSSILDMLHKGIHHALKQGEGANRDGMDLALCVFDHDSKNLKFSGARNPLIYIQNGELFKISADKYSIGGREAEQEFTQVEVNMEIPTVFYIFSDGYEDQFGGAEGRKFMIKRLRNYFLEIHEKSMPEQRYLLEETFDDWSKHTEQVDDVLVMGFRV